jgi:hypothetical protein
MEHCTPFGAAPHSDERKIGSNRGGERVFCCSPPSPFAISFDHPGGTLHFGTEGAFDLSLHAVHFRVRHRLMTM